MSLQFPIEVSREDIRPLTSAFTFKIFASISAAHQISIFAKKEQRRHFRSKRKPKRKSLS
jgi:hypothetical protein